MAVQELPFSLRPLHRSFNSARLWLWLQRGLRTLAISICVSLGFALVVALLALFRAPDAVQTWLWLLAAATPVAGLVAALLSRPSESEAVRKVDVRLDLRQQLGTAQELISTGSDGPLVHWQLAQASELASDLPVSKAFPLLPRRGVLVALLLAIVTGGLLELVSLGVTIPNPFSSVKIPGMTKEAPQAPERPLFANQQAGAATKPRSAALDPTRQLLSEIQKQSQLGALSQQAAASALQQANAELNRAAQESLTRQQAMDNLATNLRDTAAGNDIAQSLRQGDYQQAAQQIRDISSQLDQLSPAAKDQLSQALNAAAAQSQSLQSLARAENRASQAVQRVDTPYAGQSLDRLAQQVQDAGSQVIPQDQLAEAWQQLEDMNKQLAGQNKSGANQAPTSPQVGQGSDGTEQRSSQMQQGQGANDGEPTRGDQSGSSANGSTQMPGSGGLPGNTPGGPPLGDANQRLGPDGKPLDVSGKITGQFSGQEDTGATPPSVMRQGDTNSADGSGQSGTAASAPAENVFVPGDRRSIVRDYFNGGTGPQ